MTTMYRKVTPAPIAPLPVPRVHPNQAAANAAWDAIADAHRYDYSGYDGLGVRKCTCGREFSHARGMSVHYTNTRIKARVAYETAMEATS